MKRPTTPRGYAAMRKELQRLKAMRPELAQAIEIARGHGDLSENADYDAAKEKSGLTEARIRDLDAKLALAEVIDPRSITVTNKVLFGLTVKIEDIDSGEKRTLTIVGSDESDVDAGLISYETPLARALIGKTVGDISKVALPSGSREYEILEVSVEYNDDDLAVEEAEE